MNDAVVSIQFSSVRAFSDEWHALRVGEIHITEGKKNQKKNTRFQSRDYLNLYIQ